MSVAPSPCGCLLARCICKATNGHIYKSGRAQIQGNDRVVGDGCLDMAGWSFPTKPIGIPLLRTEHDKLEGSVARIHAGDDRARTERAPLTPGDLLKNYLTTCNRKQRESSELWKLPSGDGRQEMAA